MTLIINNFEGAYKILCETIENGYDYGIATHEVSMYLNLDNTKTRIICELMNNHNFDKDPQYEKFKNDLQQVING